MSMSKINDYRRSNNTPRNVVNLKVTNVRRIYLDIVEHQVVRGGRILQGYVGKKN